MSIITSAGSTGMLEPPGITPTESHRLQRPQFIDDDFAALTDRLLDQVGDQPFEVVFAGDTFELDGASAYTGRPRQRATDRHG